MFDRKTVALKVRADNFIQAGHLARINAPKGWRIRDERIARVVPVDSVSPKTKFDGDWGHGRYVFTVDLALSRPTAGATA